MKRAFKYLLTVLLLFITCFSLCSCQSLDELKADQAFYGYNKDGKVNKEEIIFRGNTYKMLTEVFDSIEYKNNVWFEGKLSTYVTENDVPVLLMDYFGDTVEFSDDCIIICRYPDYDYSIGNAVYYCREDMYDEVCKKIKNHEFGDYYINMYNDEQHEFEYKKISKSEAIDAAIADITATAKLVGYEILPEEYESCYIQKAICGSCLFYAGIEIDKVGGKYYINNPFTDNGIYEVPEKYVGLFKDILDEYISNANKYEYYVGVNHLE